MKPRNWIAGAALALASLFAVPAFAAQGALCLPTTGVYSGLTAAGYINAAIKALETQNSGASAPANDCTLSPVAGQLWLDTSASPYTVKIYDGTSTNWLALGTVDASNHRFTPSGYGAKLFGTSSGSTLLQPAATASGTLTLPAATDTLVGRATTDTLTNKTLLDGSTLVANTSDATKKLAFDVSGVTTGTTRTLAIPDASGTMLLTSTSPPVGQVQLLRTSSTVVTLLPYQGRYVSFPSGVNATIGSSGVAATISSLYVNGSSGQTLSASTLYYVYLFMNSGTPTLDFSTTGHATDSTTGIEIKSGDNTRVLVGMVYPQSGPVFTDSAAARLVATWFNQRVRQLANAFTAVRTTTSNSYTELNTEIRLQMLNWGGTSLTAAYVGAVTNSGSNSTFSGLSLDGNSSTNGSFYAAGQGATSSASVPGPVGTFSPSEGFHYITMLGAVSGGTGSWQTAAGFTAQGQLSGAVTQ